MGRVARAALHAALFLAAIEGIFFVFGAVSMYRGNPYRLYDQARLLAAIDSNLPTERAGSATGWPHQGLFPVRAHPSGDQAQCGTAWGGSFTYADDVADAEAWPHLLSTALGCGVENHGIDGFAVDQTLLHFRQYKAKDHFVILGLAEPMIVADGIASWTFVMLNDDKSPKASVTKPFFTLNDHDQLRLTPRPGPTVDAVNDHIRGDLPARNWTEFKFPFSVRVATAIYRKLTRPLFAEYGLFQSDEQTKYLLKLGARLIAEMAEEARQRNERFVLLLIPRPEDVLEPHVTYMNILQTLPAPINELCLIDPANELKEAAIAHPESVRTKSGHYGTFANAAIAKAAVRGLKACGLGS